MLFDLDELSLVAANVGAEPGCGTRDGVELHRARGDSEGA